ncbi:hypothetical protein CA13_11170 [Planctomycetes bacterium CA13]|uniref:Uncharacterized protein n=1 Tax=Novipirellula herctigrandis TaxID=2527986 RepID=A0A5C5YXU4_9BACT|nr:hypothetical protein CA13_11170 [Planctomycetes bacterium CA13]
MDPFADAYTRNLVVRNGDLPLPIRPLSAGQTQKEQAKTIEYWDGWPTEPIPCDNASDQRIGLWLSARHKFLRECVRWHPLHAVRLN